MVTYNLYFITDFIFCVQDSCALLNSTLGIFSKANTDKPEKKPTKLLGLFVSPNMLILISQKVYIKIKQVYL